ncbi:MAG: hypothetical protein EB056_01570 [Verrucomicrobia bacterium]|nr:hypothetical protein [Verrucomicrobiota bacterium]
MFDESKSPVMQELAQKWQQRGASVVTGKAELGETRFVAAILSPGVDPRRPVVGQLQKAGVPILGELELGARACLCPVVAVTGTNGKSTTTELIAEIYQAAGKKAVASRPESREDHLYRRDFRRGLHPAEGLALREGGEGVPARGEPSSWSPQCRKSIGGIGRGGCRGHFQGSGKESISLVPSLAAPMRSGGGPKRGDLGQ